MNGFAELQGQISDNIGMIVGVYRCLAPVASFHDSPILYVAHNKTICLYVVLSSSQVLACAFDSAPIVTSTSPSHRKQWTSKVLHQETRRPFVPPKGAHMVSVRCCWVSQGGGTSHKLLCDYHTDRCSEVFGVYVRVCHYNHQSVGNIKRHTELRRALIFVFPRLTFVSMVTISSWAEAEIRVMNAKLLQLLCTLLRAHKLAIICY